MIDKELICIDEDFDTLSDILKKQKKYYNKDDFYVKLMTEDDVFAVFEIENKLLGTNNMGTISSALNSDTLFYYVLVNSNNAEIVGFLEISIIGPDCELYDIAIKKQYQGHHLSNILMDYLIKICSEKKCETIFLEVNSINNKAIRLYKKYGFARYSTRKNYYGKFDAVLMKKDL